MTVCTAHQKASQTLGNSEWSSTLMSTPAAIVTMTVTTAINIPARRAVMSLLVSRRWSLGCIGAVTAPLFA